MANHVCPWWAGYLLINPLRQIIQNPEKIVSSYVAPKMKVMDVGCAMGFFSLPLARLVGEQGKVYCIDLQERMIETLVKRARKAGLDNRIETRICSYDSLGIEDIWEEIDFALAFAVVHEVDNKGHLLTQIWHAMKPGGKLLISEPKGHVSERDFEAAVSLAQKTGFNLLERPAFVRSNSVVLSKI